MPDYVFISYSRDDQEFVLKLRGDLEKQGVSVWLDTGGIRAGEAWRERIVDAIKNCEVFVIVLSPTAVASRNVVKELSIADGSNKPIIPVVYQDFELTSEMEYQLAGLQRLDFTRGGYEDNVVDLVEVLPGQAEQPVGVSEPISKPITSKQPPDVMQITTPVQMELVRVPAGEFLMGSDPAKDKDARENEQPQHRLSVAEFYIGRYPVTNTQYSVFVKASGHDAPVHWEKGIVPEGKNDHPVVAVSWYDTIAFGRWLSGETGKQFHLPSEAEWEYAARGGPLSRSYLYAGGDDPDEVAWFSENSGNHTHPVGGKQPNELGVYDMSGNVVEWSRSLWGDDMSEPDFKYPYDSGDGREDLQAPENIYRVLRGGAFHVNPRFVRCACRYWYSPGGRYYYLGFRVVVSPSGSGL